MARRDLRLASLLTLGLLSLLRDDLGARDVGRGQAQAPRDGSSEVYADEEGPRTLRLAGGGR